MSNAYLQHGNVGIDWLTGKYKLYVMDRAGYPTITIAAPTKVNIVEELADLTYTTSVAHSLSVGDRVIIAGLNANINSHTDGNTYSSGALIRKANVTPMIHMVMKGGTTSTTAPSYNKTMGGYTHSGTVLMKAFMAVAAQTNPNNGVHIVKAVPSTTTFTIRAYNNPNWNHTVTGKLIKVGNVLTNWNTANIKGISPTLGGKLIRGTALDAGDTTIDVGVYNTANGFFLLVKTAALDTDTTDYTDANKLVVAYWDDTQGINSDAFTGIGSIILNNFIQL